MKSLSRQDVGEVSDKEVAILRKLSYGGRTGTLMSNAVAE